jgi:mannosyltransferase OCH1-like enzyme
MKETIQGLWIGAELSAMEQLSIASFLINGHDYHLYVYEDVKRVPAGAVVKDASEVLPRSMVFEYRDFKSYAGFSNFFRYKLLLERGGWWADTDIVCLRPFDFEDEHVFATELFEGAEVITSGVVKAPARSPAMDYAWQVCRRKDPAQLAWGETGPRLIAKAVAACSLDRHRKPYRVFCPLNYSEWQKIIEPECDLQFDADTRAIHLWNEMWRRAGVDKNQSFSESSLYERLKRKYLAQ